MSIEAVVPFKPVNPKSRLSSVLSTAERELFAEAMLTDVVMSLKEAGCNPFILSTVPLHCAYARVNVSAEELNPALNSLSGVLQARCSLSWPTYPWLHRVLSGGLSPPPCDMALGPGRGGGTNAIFIKDRSRFHVDYYGASFLKHREIAEKAGLSCEIVDSFRLHTDVDEREDLVELMIHGRGKAVRFSETLWFLPIDRKRACGCIAEH